MKKKTCEKSEEEKDSNEIGSFTHCARGINLHRAMTAVSSVED